jgi:hypothetical protein
VNLFWKILDPSFDPTDAASVPTVEPDARVLCGPCHGDNPGAATWHNEEDGVTVVQDNVDIRTRNISGFSWGANAAYETLDLSAPGSGGHAASGGNQQCENLDCHGSPDPARDTGDGSTEDDRAHFPEVLTWQDVVSNTTDGSGQNQVSKKTAVCKWCHDDTPATVVVKNPDGTSDLYASAVAPGAAASYFRPPSGYARGGHGDSEIQNEDPFVDSDSGNATPLDCTDCHDDTLADFTANPGMMHFPVDSGNIHRLANTTLENNTHSTAALCNSCHDGADYPGPGNPPNHHPSYWGATAANPTAHAIEIPAGGSGQEIESPVDGATQWNEVAPPPDHYEQTDYGAANFSGDPDFFVDWWGGSPGSGNQNPPPEPNPFAVMAFERYVGNQNNTDRIMCVTCHNPHGTDLFTFDQGSSGQDIPDNNMLRLRDEDNTLCNACH